MEGKAIILTPTLVRSRSDHALPSLDMSSLGGSRLQLRNAMPARAATSRRPLRDMLSRPPTNMSYRYSNPSYA